MFAMITKLDLKDREKEDSEDNSLGNMGRWLGRTTSKISSNVDLKEVRISEG